MKKLFLILTILAFLPSIVLAQASLQVTSTVTPDPVVPGNDGYVEFVITNVGNTTADSLKASLQRIESPLKAESTSFIESIGALRTNQVKSFIFKFSVPSNTASGFYIIEFKLSSCSDGVCRNTIQSAAVTVQSPSSLRIDSIEPNELRIGENTTVNLVLKNAGGNEINNIQLKWNSSSDILPFGSDDEEFVSRIQANQQYTIPLNIFVSQGADSGVYPFDINITYDDATGSSQTTSTTVGILVTGDVDFVISLDETNLAYGSTGYVDIDIANRGTAAANFLSVMASSPYGENEFYIGELEADDEDAIELTQNLGGAYGPYDLDLTLTYKDNFNNEHVVERIVRVTPSPPSFLIVGTVVLVIVVAGVWYWWKKKKK